MNRYTQLSSASYNPMTLQELMLAPSYLRQKHDENQNTIAGFETELAKVNRLDVHADLTSARQKELYDELSGFSDELATNGFSNLNKSNLIKFNKKYQSEISPTGLLGKVNAAKQQYDIEKQNYITNATKMGYSPESAINNWEKHSLNYKNQFDGKNIMNIEGLYSPEYVNAVDKATKLFKDAGLTESEISNLGKSNIITTDPKGQYILTTKGKQYSGSNVVQLQAAVDYINSQILNPNSTTHQSIIHQGKNPNDILSEIQGLASVYVNNKKSSASGSEISNFTPRIGQDESDVPNFVTNKIQGYNVEKLDPNSILVGLKDTEKIQYDNNGNIISGSSQYATYEDKIRDIKSKKLIAKNDPEGKEGVRYNPETGIYEERVISNSGLGFGSSFKWKPIEKDVHHFKDEINKLKTKNPYFKGFSDREVIEKLNTYKQNLSSNYVETIDVVGSNYEWLNDRLFGSEKGSGEKGAGIFNNQGAVVNGKKLTSDKIIKELGYKNDTEFKELGKPVVAGYVPALGKFKVNVLDADGVTQNMFIEDVNQLKNSTSIILNTSKSLLEGKDFANLGQHKTNSNYNIYMINDYTGNPFIVFSTNKNAMNPSDISESIVGSNGPVPALKNPNDKIYRYNDVAGLEKISLLNNPLFKQVAGLKNK